MGSALERRVVGTPHGPGPSRYVMPRVSSDTTGFFHSLFMGGFAETQRKKRSVGHFDDDWQGEDIELVFDDPNITRAAFE